MSGLIGKKLGMTSIFNEDGDNVVCTVVQAGPCVVTQIRSMDADGYEAIQLGFDERSEKSVTRALAGHFEAAGTAPRRKVVEFRPSKIEVSIGDEVRVEDVFEKGDRVHVSAVSKGKGFQGVVKRHGFSGVGGRTHGQHNRERHPGSIGQASDPSRVFKGMLMGGRTGGKRVKTANLQVVEIYPEHDTILIKGAIPGPKNGYVEITK